MNTKYKIEGGIDFFTELYSSLDKNEDKNEDNICLITHQPLTEKYVELKCGHKFNYVPLYNDLINFKKKFNLMESKSTRLKNEEIRCPYCRKKQTELMPYYHELGLKEVYGVNHSDSGNTGHNFMYHCGYLTVNPNYNELEQESDTNKKFIKCYNVGLNVCLENFSTDKKYCYCHKKIIIKEYNIKKKEELKKEKKEAKQKLKHEKEQAKQKLKDEKEQAKQSKQKSNKTSIENVVLGPITITKEQIEENNGFANEMCKQILKSGINKGKQCGCKIHLDELCKRHYVNVTSNGNKNMNNVNQENIL